MIQKVVKIYYYVTSSKQEPVRDFIDSLEKTEKQKLFRVFEHFKNYGLVTTIPHIKKLSGIRLWEIKLVGKNSIRVIYSVVFNNDVLVLLGFIKKAQKTPSKYIATALIRLRDWEARYGIDK